MSVAAASIAFHDHGEAWQGPARREHRFRAGQRQSDQIFTRNRGLSGAENLPNPNR